MLILTAGVALGLGIFAPSLQDANTIDNANGWLMVINAVLIGLSLPAPCWTLRAERGGHPPLGAGGLFALTMGLASLSMLPPALIARLTAGKSATFACLYFVLPLVGLWYTAATALGGQWRAMFRAEAPWIERYGGLLALAWSPLGLWHLFHFYSEVF
jgi:hypothetical protein